MGYDMPMRQSDAEYRRQRAATTTASQWHEANESWFDGTVDSVDRRLASCNNLLALARDAVGHEGIGPSTRTHLAAIVDLSASQEALTGLRRDLLTAASDREAAGVSCPQCGKYLHDEIARSGHAHGANGEVYDADPQYGSESRGEFMNRGHGGLPPTHLSHRDRRYVALESAKFIQANLGIPADELAIRAANHAQLQTSTFTQQRSAAVTAAFVNRVAELHQDTPRPRVAMRSTSVPVCPDEFIFL